MYREQSARPKIFQDRIYNHQRQQYLDVVGLIQHNKKLDARPPAKARMDEEDRLEYINEVRAKLLNDNVFMKSSRRGTHDS